MPQHNGADDRLVVERVLVLHEHGHALVLVHADFALIRLDFAG